MTPLESIIHTKRQLRHLEAMIASLYQKQADQALIDKFIGNHSELTKHLCKAMAEPSAQYGIYQVFDAQGDLLYIGMSGNIGERILTHFGYSDKYPQQNEWSEDAAEVLVFHMDSKFMAEALEKELIRKRRPRDNKAHNTDKERSALPQASQIVERRTPPSQDDQANLKSWQVEAWMPEECTCERFTDYYKEKMEIVAREIWFVYAHEWHPRRIAECFQHLMTEYGAEVFTDAFRLACNRQWVTHNEDEPQKFHIGRHNPSCALSNRIYDLS